jgi:predicted small integral membrane protein
MDYPAQLDVQTPDKVANWRPLVHWLMAIPHFIISYVLTIVAEVVAVISWFAILFTGKLPAGLADVQCMVIRYTTRAGVYAGFLHEEFPPFEFSTTGAEPGGTPVSIDLTPELEGRNRLTCALRIIWAIPALIVTFLIMIVAFVCWFLAFFAVLFTGKWPDAFRSWAMKGLRAQLRLNAYVMLLTDEYPPMSFD